MPARQRHFLRVLAEQDWIESYLATDPCLFDELLAAYVARGRAKAAGASAEDLAHGDRALAAIKSGDSKDEDAWGRAATAIRRFGEALGEIRARPKPQHGHALRKRYGRSTGHALGRNPSFRCPICRRTIGTHKSVSTGALHFAEHTRGGFGHPARNPALRCPVSGYSVEAAAQFAAGRPR
jgi:hypothetical protein